MSSIGFTTVATDMGEGEIVARVFTLPQFPGTHKIILVLILSDAPPQDLSDPKVCRPAGLPPAAVPRQQQRQMKKGKGEKERGGRERRVRGKGKRVTKERATVAAENSRYLWIIA